MPKFIDKEYLIREFCINEKSIHKIAEECSCSIYNVYGYLHRYGIEARRGAIERKVVIVKCSFCSKPINRRPSTMNKRNFCDYDCYHSWMVGNTARENSSNWKGGISAFCSNDLKTRNWRSIRKEVFRRFPFCVICGQKKNRMNVHHIIPRKKNESMTYDISNLITLCHVCHLKVKGKELNWEAYFTRLICKGGELQETLNSKEHGNLQPSPMNGVKVVGKVHRLMGDEPTNKPNTSAAHESDDIVGAYAKA